MIPARVTVIARIRGGILLLPLEFLGLIIGGQLFHKLLVLLMHLGKVHLCFCRLLVMPVCILGFEAVFRRTIRIPLTAILSGMAIHRTLASRNTKLTSNLLLVRPILMFLTRGFVLGLLRDWTSQFALFGIKSLLGCKSAYP